jgi:hypothetical protein
LGEERFDHLEEIFRAHGEMSEDQFRFACAFAGIQGYPVQVWYRQLWPEQAAVDHAVDFQSHRIGYD